MDKDIGISAVSRQYWVAPTKKVKDAHSVDKKKTNLSARIVTCVTDFFPQLKDVNESKFVRFQEQINIIITQELKD